MSDIIAKAALKLAQDNSSSLNEKANKPKGIISLPKQYRLVVGDTFELFYRGILRVGNIYNYNINVSCSKGNAFKRKYKFTPSAGDIGSYTLTVTVKDDTGVVIDTKSTLLVVKAKAKVGAIPSDDGSHNLIHNNLVQIGYWANTVNGAVQASASYSVTEEMPVIAGETYQVSPYARNVIFYDSNHNYVSTSAQTITSIVIPAGVAYARCNYLSTAVLTTRVFVKGTVAPTGYVQTYEEYINGMVGGAVVLNIGDSLTAAGVWVEEMYRRLTGTGGTPSGDTLAGLNFIGSVGTTPKYEGYGGWAINNYLSSTSPFYINGAINFATYASNKSASTIDIVNILLGWNSSETDETTYKGLLRNFINSIRSSFPNAKINLIGIEVGNKDGMGDNYGATWDWFEKTQYVFNLNQWLEDITDEYDKVFFTQLSGQFDSEYNMPVSTVAVNTRNSVTETVGTNGVHPYAPGYNQIADAVYRAMHHILVSN